MNILRGEKLRQAWEARGNPTCDHPQVVQERAQRGTRTGDYFCTVCGAYAEPKERTSSAIP